MSTALLIRAQAVCCSYVIPPLKHCWFLLLNAKLTTIQSYIKYLTDMRAFPSGQSGFIIFSTISFFFFSCWTYICFISSHPVHHRRSCTSCPSSLRPMNCTSSPSTSALRASPETSAAERQPCDPARAVSGTTRPFHRFTHSLSVGAIILFIFLALEDLHHATTMKSSWWTTSTRSGFLR